VRFCFPDEVNCRFKNVFNFADVFFLSLCIARKNIRSYNVRIFNQATVIFGLV